MLPPIPTSGGLNCAASDPHFWWAQVYGRRSPLPVGLIVGSQIPTFIFKFSERSRCQTWSVPNLLKVKFFGSGKISAEGLKIFCTSYIRALVFHCNCGEIFPCLSVHCSETPNLSARVVDRGVLSFRGPFLHASCSLWRAVILKRTSGRSPFVL